MHLVEGDPRTAMIDAVQQFEASTIVVGSTGKGRIARVFLGSVSSYLAQHSPVPVIVVK